MNSAAKPSIICLSSSRIQGEGWSCDITDKGGLPSVAEIQAALPDAAFGSESASLLLEDELLHPLRVQLDDKPARSETADFLLWKLKRILPYPVDQVVLRHTPLPETNTWLTMTLPKRWTQDVFELFAARGVHLGHIGGLFTTLLETQTQFRKQAVLALFGDFYLLALLDGKGGFRLFRTRRLPFTAAGELDLNTLVQVDLAPVLAGVSGSPALFVLGLDPRHDNELGEIRAGLEAHLSPVTAPALDGNTHARLISLQHSGVS